MYATLPALKSYLGITETTDDTLLTRLLTVAQNSIDKFCGQSFEATADTTRYFSAASYRNDRVTQGRVWGDSQWHYPTAPGAVDGRDLILDAPLLSVTTLVNGDGTTVSSANYQLLPLNESPKHTIRLKTSSNLTWTYASDIESDTIAVTGRWAFSLTADATIEQVTVRFAAYLYRQKNNSGDLDRAMLMGGGGVILPAKLPADIEKFLVDGGYVRLTTSS